MHVTFLSKISCMKNSLEGNKNLRKKMTPQNSQLRLNMKSYLGKFSLVRKNSSTKQSSYKKRVKKI